MTFLNVGFLEANHFRKTEFPDGIYWIRACHDEVFVQVTDDLRTATTFEFGHIEDIDSLGELEYILSKYQDVK